MDNKTRPYLIIAFNLFLFIFIATIVSAEQGRFYSLSINYDQGKLTNSVILNEGYYDLTPIGTNSFKHETYYLRILSTENSKLYSGEFNIPLFAPDIGALDKTSVTLSLPYFDTAKEIRIYNANYSLIYTIPVDFLSDQEKIKPYLDTLNRFNPRNNVCNSKSDGICDLDCNGTEDIDCIKYSGNENQKVSVASKLLSKNNLLQLAAALLLITLTIVIVFIFNKKQKRKESILEYIEFAKSKGYSREQIEKIMADDGVPIEEIKPQAERAYKPAFDRAKR